MDIKLAVLQPSTPKSLPVIVPRLMTLLTEVPPDFVWQVIQALHDQILKFNNDPEDWQPLLDLVKNKDNFPNTDKWLSLSEEMLQAMSAKPVASSYKAIKQKPMVNKPDEGLAKSLKQMFMPDKTLRLPDKPVRPSDNLKDNVDYVLVKYQKIRPHGEVTYYGTYLDKPIHDIIFGDLDRIKDTLENQGYREYYTGEDHSEYGLPVYFIKRRGDNSPSQKHTASVDKPTKRFGKSTKRIDKPTEKVEPNSSGMKHNVEYAKLRWTQSPLKSMITYYSLHQDKPGLAMMKDYQFDKAVDVVANQGFHVYHVEDQYNGKKAYFFRKRPKTD
jgi:hypothetical protein